MIKHKIIRLIQLILVVVFIIFEELIWEGIARPVYRYIHGLKILQKVEEKVRLTPPYAILFIFLILFAVVEGIGIYAGILFVSGKALTGTLLYIAKIPIAAFTFWLFRVSESKLMQFGWFAWSYEKVITTISRIKGSEIYILTIEKAKSIKNKLKFAWIKWKESYLQEDSTFMTKLKRLYRAIKSILRKHQKTDV